MSASSKLRWRRYVNQLRFAHRERDLVEQIAHESAPDFQEYLEKYCAENNLNLRELNKQHSQKIADAYCTHEPPPSDIPPPDCAPGTLVIRDPTVAGASDDPKLYQMTQDEKEIHEAFHRLFRRLAMKLHPDKIDARLSDAERAQQLAQFKDARSALDEKRYFVLIDLAEQLRIATPRNYKQQIRWMKAEVKKAEEAVRVEKQTYNYLFAEAETDGDRDVVIVRFLAHLFGPQIFTQNA